MQRHTIELWTDDGTPGVLVNWRCEDVDQADIIHIASNVELVGSVIWVARALSTTLTMALLYSPSLAQQRMLELDRGRQARPGLF